MDGCQRRSGAKQRPPRASDKPAAPGTEFRQHLAVGAQRDADHVRLCRRLAFGASLGVVQLVDLSPRQRRGFLDGLLSREGLGAQPA